jgi:succinate dehydrogenase flavin-adding protein (antitoxin of CptAB toxin-antitoxin module)
MNLNSSDLENLKKTILYRGCYRGTRENDFLIKEFINFIFDFVQKNENSDFLLMELNSFVSKDDQEILNLIKNLTNFKKKSTKIEDIFLDFYNKKLK